MPRVTASRARAESQTQVLKIVLLTTMCMASSNSESQGCITIKCLKGIWNLPLLEIHSVPVNLTGPPLSSTWNASPLPVEKQNVNEGIGLSWRPGKGTWFPKPGPLLDQQGPEGRG